MKIELKNIKHSAFASHETNCFEASVYIDGVRAGVVSNGGYGGCHDYHPTDLALRLNAYANTLPPVVTSMDDPRDPSKKFTYEQDADSVIDDLMNANLYSKDLKRALAKKILFVGDDNKIYETQSMPANNLKIHLTKPNLLETLKAKAVLNLMPFGDALSIYRAGGIHV